MPGYPLQLGSHPADLIAHPAWTEARETIINLVDAGVALIALLGPPGTGKTTLLRDLATAFAQRGRTVCLLDSGDSLADVGAVEIVMVDEAERMSPARLQELLARTGLVIILAALPASWKRFEGHSGARMVQLPRLSPQQACKFIAARLTQLGLPKGCLTEAAWAQLIAHGHGVPRLLLGLLGLALFIAGEEHAACVTGSHVEQAVEARGGSPEPNAIQQALVEPVPTQAIVLKSPDQEEPPGDVGLDPVETVTPPAGRLSSRVVAGLFVTAVVAAYLIPGAALLTWLKHRQTDHTASWAGAIPAAIGIPVPWSASAGTEQAAAGFPRGPAAIPAIAEAKPAESAAAPVSPASSQPFRLAMGPSTNPPRESMPPQAQTATAGTDATTNSSSDALPPPLPAAADPGRAPASPTPPSEVATAPAKPVHPVAVGQDSAAASSTPGPQSEAAITIAGATPSSPPSSSLPEKTEPAAAPAAPPQGAASSEASPPSEGAAATAEPVHPAVGGPDNAPPPNTGAPQSRIAMAATDATPSSPSSSSLPEKTEPAAAPAAPPEGVVSSTEPVHPAAGGPDNAPPPNTVTESRVATATTGATPNSPPAASSNLPATPAPAAGPLLPPPGPVADASLPSEGEAAVSAEPAQEVSPGPVATAMGSEDAAVLNARSQSETASAPTGAVANLPSGGLPRPKLRSAAERADIPRLPPSGPVWSEGASLARGPSAIANDATGTDQRGRAAGPAQPADANARTVRKTREVTVLRAERRPQQPQLRELPSKFAQANWPIAKVQSEPVPSPHYEAPVTYSQALRPVPYGSVAFTPHPTTTRGVPLPVQQLLSARRALMDNNSYEARGLLEAAQTEIVFEAETAPERSGIAAGQIANALSMLNSGDAVRALPYLERALTAIKPAS